MSFTDNHIPRNGWIASSESERERESKERQTATIVEKVVALNPKSKKGRQLKSANIRSVALTSSESEFDEFLETLRPSQQLTNEDSGGRRRKRTGGKGKLWIEPASPSAVPSKLEQIVEELKSETRRVRRTSPRKTQSTLEGEQSTESSGEVSGQKHETGQPRKESKAAESSTSECHNEVDVEDAQMTVLEETTNGELSLVSEVVYDESNTSNFELEVEEETTVQKVESKVTKQGKKKQQTKPADSASSEAQTEEDTEAIKQAQRTAPKKSKSGRGQLLKSTASQLPKSASSESEVGEHVKVTQQNSELGKKTATKQGRQQSLHSTTTSAHPPTSTTSESETEKVTEGKQRKRRSPRKMTSGTSEDQAGSESENRMLRPKKKKKKSKAEHQAASINDEDKVTARGNEGPPVESGEEEQYVYSDYDTGDVTLHAAHLTTGEDNNVGSKDTEVDHSLDGASKEGGEKEEGLSGAASIDVSVLPRLNKRKRGKGNKLVLGPKSKKRKKNPTATESNVVEHEMADEPADSEVYSMSTSGEGDNLEGMDITQSGGGRRYRRMRVEASKRHTPGVRRGSRTSIAPVRHWENEQVEYDTNRESGKYIAYVHVLVQQRFSYYVSIQRRLVTIFVECRLNYCAP